MENTGKIMIQLICRELFGGAALSAPLSEEQADELYRLALFHDMAHLVGDALLSDGLLPDGEAKAKFEEQRMMAVFRCENQTFELERIKSVLSAEKVDFVPLKGAVIRGFYPEPWQRTSCDIDVLVHESGLEKAAAALTSKLGYIREEMNYHDLPLSSRSGVHLELHFSVLESNEQLDPVLSEAWEHAEPADGAEKRFDGAFFMFHFIAHAAYHFIRGGCGVKPLLDLYILDKSFDYDCAQLDALLERARLTAFVRNMRRLAAVWFGGEAHDETTASMERYILSGGVYGTNRQKVAMQLTEGRGKHLLRRFWKPYPWLCERYPQLKGRRILQPVYEVRRWCELIGTRWRFKGGMKDLKTSFTVSDETVAEVKKLFDNIGLDPKY